jgi:hypothetical protein
MKPTAGTFFNGLSAAFLKKMRMIADCQTGETKSNRNAALFFCPMSCLREARWSLQPKQSERASSDSRQEKPVELPQQRAAGLGCDLVIL